MTRQFKIVTDSSDYPSNVNMGKVNLVVDRSDKSGSPSTGRFYDLKGVKFRQNVAHDYVITQYDPTSQEFVNSITPNVDKYRGTGSPSHIVYSQQAVNYLNFYDPVFIPDQLTSSVFIKNIKSGTRRDFILFSTQGISPDYNQSFYRKFDRGFAEYSFHLQRTKEITSYQSIGSFVNDLNKLGLVTEKVKVPSTRMLGANSTDPLKTDLGLRLINIFEARQDWMYCFSYVLFDPINPNVLSSVFHIWINFYTTYMSHHYSDELKYFMPEYYYNGIPRFLNNLMYSSINCYYDIDGSLWHILEGDEPTAICLNPAFSDKMQGILRLGYYGARETTPLDRHAAFISSYYPGSYIRSLLKLGSDNKPLPDSILRLETDDPVFKKKQQIIETSVQQSSLDSFKGAPSSGIKLTDLINMFSSSGSFSLISSMKKRDFDKFVKDTEMSVSKAGILVPTTSTKTNVLSRYM